jgi:AcrR family transcriptional regulator
MGGTTGNDMRRTTGTKRRIMDATAELFRRRGYTGTGMKQIVTAADAPFGSLYHFFPGGKTQLGEEVVRRSGAIYRELVLAALAPAPDAVTGVAGCFAEAAAVLEKTDFADACPVAAVALETAATNEPLRVATAEVFESWTSALAGWLVGQGVEREAARPLALSLISLLEGAFVLARARRSTEPVHAAAAIATAAVREALEAARTAGGV